MNYAVVLRRREFSSSSHCMVNKDTWYWHKTIESARRSYRILKSRNPLSEVIFLERKELNVNG